MMSKNHKKIGFTIFISIVVSLLLLNQDWYRLFPKTDLEKVHLKTLRASGEKAIDNLDIPVSCILLYQNKILVFLQLFAKRCYLNHLFRQLLRLSEDLAKILKFLS